MENQFDIYIYGASETVDRNREILNDLDESCGHAMEKFAQCCQEEEDAFGRSAGEMNTQVWKTRDMADKALSLTHKCADCRCHAEENQDKAWELVKYAKELCSQIEDARKRIQCKLHDVESQLSDCRRKKEVAEMEIGHERAFLPAREEQVRHLKEQKRLYWENGDFEKVQQMEADLRYPMGEIRKIKDSIADIRKRELDPVNEKIAELSPEKASLEALLSEAEGVAGEAESYRSQAEQFYAVAEQNTSEGKARYDQSEENRKKTDEAQQKDRVYDRYLRGKSKVSRKVLAAAKDSFSGICGRDHESLQYTSGVMSKLSEQMLQYTTYSLEG